MMHPVGSNALQGFSSLIEWHVRLVVCGAQYRFGLVCPAVIRGTSFRCRSFRPTVIWSDISKGGRDVIPGHVGYRDAWSHRINGASEASQFQVSVIAIRRVYAPTGYM